jgi:hypothetical protein
VFLPSSEQTALLDEYSKALFKEPENPIFYYEKAAFLHSRGYWVDAISLLDKALAYGFIPFLPFSVDFVSFVALIRN